MHYFINVNSKPVGIRALLARWLNIQDFFFFFQRLDIEVCTGCECDFLAISTSYNLLKRADKTCGRNSAEYYKYLHHVGKPGGGDFGDTTMYVRFVSDETVHRKGFKLSFIAYSSKGKCWLKTVLN